MDVLAIESRVQELFKSEDIYHEWGLSGDTLEVDIIWGDWKHDHICIDRLITQVFDVSNAYEVVTEEDGSDSYSAIHYYTFSNKDNPILMTERQRLEEKVAYFKRLMDEHDFYKFYYDKAVKQLDAIEG